NQPVEYIATNSIDFLPGFESAVPDSFQAYISPGCDPVINCQDLFTNFFNTRYNYSPAYTWIQIDSLYLANCGRSPYVCGYKDYGCNELHNLLSDYTNNEPLGGSNCQQNFTDYFNSYYHNIEPITFSEINALYLGCGMSNMEVAIC